MKLFKAKKGIHIPGRKDDTSILQTEKFVNPEFVYIPLSVKGTDFEVYVKAGDKVKMGQIIARRTEEKGLPLVKHASVSGDVVGTERKLHRTGLPYVCIKIKNDFKDTPADFTPVANINTLDSAKLVEIMQNAGIVGMGGAGFPTFMKYRNVKGIDTVIINGAECEPYVTSDYRVMLEDTKKVVDGLHLMMKAANAANGIIAIKEGKEKLYEKLAEAVKGCSDIKVMQVPDEYPAGWERQIVYRTLKRSYEDYPFECGVIVDNVSTSVALAEAVLEGKPSIERVVTVSGEGIIHPKNFRVRIGTLSTDLINLAGGIAEDLGDIRIIAGGPMMGVAQKQAEFVVSRGVNAILILLGQHEFEVPHKQPVGDVLLGILHLTEHDPYHFVRDEQPCVRCGTCVKNCPAGLQPTLLRQASLAKNEELLEKLDVTKCISCGTCAYVCPSHIQVTDAIKKGKVFYMSKHRNK